MLETSPPQFFGIDTQPHSEVSHDRLAKRFTTNVPSSCIDISLQAPLLPWANAHVTHISEEPRIVSNNVKWDAANDFLFSKKISPVFPDTGCPLMDPLLKEPSFHCESEFNEGNASTSKCDLDNMLELNGFRCV